MGKNKGSESGAQTVQQKGGAAQKPPAKPANQPAAKPGAKPAAKPAAKPEGKAAAKPSAKQTKQPWTKSKEKAVVEEEEEDTTGFETVSYKKKAPAPAPLDQQQQQVFAAPIVKREYPLFKDQAGTATKRKVQIEEECNVKIVYQSPQHAGGTGSLVISGTNVAVTRAEVAMAKALREFRHEETIPTSKSGDPMIGLIIGPKGTTMEKLRALAPGAKIQLPEEGGRFVTLYGPQADVQKIAAGIRGLSGYTVDASQVELSGEDIEVVRKIPRDRAGKPMHWILIGKNGVNARRIRDESGAELTVPPPHSASDEYSLRGSVAACDKAWMIICELMIAANENPENAEAMAALQQPRNVGPKRDPLVVPSVTGAPTCVAPRLKKKPEELRPAPAPAAPRLFATGPSKPLETMELGPPLVVDIPLPEVAHNTKAKQRIKDIATENYLKVTFDGNNSIRLEGPTLRCRMSEQSILRVWGMTKAEFPIPKSRQGDPMIGLVVGPKGTTINWIRSQVPNAFVLLPDDGCGLATDSVTIFGTPQEVEKAVEVLQTTLQSSDNARRPMADPSVRELELEVPCDRQGRPLLSVLIGTGGKNINWIRAESEGVEIDVPKTRNDIKGPVKFTLRGNETQLQLAQKAIRVLFDDDGQAGSYQEEATAPPPNPYTNCTVIGHR